MEKLDNILGKEWRNVSLSHGTMRDQDLVKSFMDFMRENLPNEYAAIVAESENVKLVSDSLNEPEDDSEQAGFFINEVLFETIDRYAPLGHSFNSHPGDGSDYGFWQADDDYDENDYF